jgi:hypothetical protein
MDVQFFSQQIWLILRSSLNGRGRGGGGGGTVFLTESRWVNPQFCAQPSTYPEAEFLDEIQTKVLKGFLLAIQSHLYSFA